MPRAQSYKHHTAYDVLTHLVIGPILTVNAITSIWVTTRNWPDTPLLHSLWIAVSFALIFINFKTRVYALRVQDRVIRLEERLRLTALLPAAEHSSIHAFTTSQLIALRFAPDAEIPSLVRRVLAENLAAREIKAAIINWRPDNQRI